MGKRAQTKQRGLQEISTTLSLFVGERASQIAEFAISAPLLAVFVVGIFDFSGAFNLRQKISSAAQAGALVAANQSTRDLDQPTSATSPPSVAAIETSVFNYLANDKVLSNANVGSCVAATVPTQPNGPLAWVYTISGCGNIAGDNLVITIDRGDVFLSSGAENVNVAASHVTVSYPHHWLFNQVIGMIVPSGGFVTPTIIMADSISQNLS